MKKLVKVHMLPTLHTPVEGTILLRHIWKNDPKLECRSLWQYKETVIIGGLKQYTTLNGSFRDDVESFVPQHLYFTSDEEIKEGDWFIRNVGSILAVEQYIKDDHLYANDRKIVATTDKALCYIKQNGHLGQAIIPLPQISQQFQEEYCKAGGIDEVLLEYEWEEGEKFELDNLDTARFINDTELENCSGTVFNKSELSKAELDYVNYDKDALATLNLKTDQNNCLIIHPVKPKLYTLEEVKIIAKNAFMEGGKSGYNSSKGLDFQTSDNWIKENL